MTPDELRRARFAAQGLAATRRRAPADVVRELLGVQAQDVRSTRLALRARRAPAAEIDTALADGTLVGSWLMRGSLHLVHRDDYPALWALTAPAALTTNQRRLGEEGVPPADADRAVTIIEQALHADPLRRSELAQLVSAAGVRTEGQAMPHILMLAALRGRVVLGPLRDGRPAFVRNRDQPPPLVGEARAAAVTDLVRRYLRGHGPATAADIATWSGLGLRDVRARLSALPDELRADGDLIDIADRAAAPESGPARLLPAFDPYLLGWRERSFAVPDEHRKQVHPGGGILRAVATVEGTAVGTWTLRRGARPTVRIEPFQPLAPEAAAALNDEAEDVVRFESAAAY